MTTTFVPSNNDTFPQKEHHKSSQPNATILPQQQLLQGLQAKGLISGQGKPSIIRLPSRSKKVKLINLSTKTSQNDQHVQLANRSLLNESIGAFSPQTDKLKIDDETPSGFQALLSNMMPAGNSQAQAMPLKPKQMRKLRVKNHNGMGAQQNLRRPVTPEQQRKQCLDCDSMRDFISGLQGEVKRLQDLSNDLNMQMIMAGCPIDLNPNTTSETSSSLAKGIKGVNLEDVSKNICPECTTTAMRKQAKQQVQEQEMRSSMNGFGMHPSGAGANSIVPRNNLTMIKQSQQQQQIASDCSAAIKDPSAGQLDGAEGGGVRIRQLQEMRRLAYQQEQLDFVGRMKGSTASSTNQNTGLIKQVGQWSIRCGTPGSRTRQSTAK